MRFNALATNTVAIVQKFDWGYFDIFDSFQTDSQNLPCQKSQKHITGFTGALCRTLTIHQNFHPSNF